MAASNVLLQSLRPDERGRLEALLIDFDRDWSEGQLAARLGDLTPGSPLRRPALIEMVKIDLERHWQNGRRVSLADYLRDYPELGAPDAVPADLVQAEYEVRCQFEGADLADFLARFPRQAGELRRLVDQAESAGGENAPARTKAPGALADTVIGPLTTPAPRRLSGQWGRYRIVKELGRGGMGTVYLAHDTQLDRPVALKVPHQAAGEEPAFAERFQREARAAAALRHPLICPVYDVGATDGVPYLTMAYVEGRPLSELVRRQPPVPPAEAAALVAAVARALQHAHECGVIHRDIKPSNILLDGRGQPVVTDFGLARRTAAGDARLTASGLLAGSPAYMAPEQLTAPAPAPGPAGDVYALGVVLYELLTARLPFEGTVAQVMAQALTAAPPAPSQYRRDIPPALEAVCLKALAKDPSRRYATMSLFAEALEGCAAARRSAPRGRLRVLIAAVAGGLLCAALLGTALWPALVTRAPGPQQSSRLAAGQPLGGAQVAGDPASHGPEAPGGRRDPDSPPPGGKGPAPDDEPPPQVKQLLDDLENEKDPDARLDAAMELGNHRYAAVVRALCARLTDEREQHYSVRRELAESLGKLGDPAAIPALASRVADARWMKEVANDHPKRNPGGDAFISDPKYGGKEAALRALRELSPEKAGEALRRALGSREALVRAWAAERLGDERGAAVIKALAGALTDEYPLVRLRAAESLGRLGDREAAPDLVRRIADDTWMARQRLPLLGGRAEEYADPEWGGKAAALAALRTIRPELVEGALRQALGSDNEGVRRWAAARLEAGDASRGTAPP